MSEPNNEPFIIRTGVDIVEIDRIGALAGSSDSRFCRRVFTDDELAYCFRKKIPYPHLAARFAAKEAVIKALGKRPAPALKSIEISTSSSGRPVVNLMGKAGEMASELGLVQIDLSLSHCRQFAVAFAIASFRRAR